MFIIYLSIFLIGLCVGSFINVVVFRLDRKGGILAGRSECPNCSTRIRPTDLIPLISYALLAGRCRNCHSKISSIYPVTEALTGLVFLVFAVKNGLTLDWNSIYSFAILGSLVSLIFFDYLYMIIPDKIIYPLAVLTVLRNILSVSGRPEHWILSGLILGGLFAIIHFASKGRGMGFGDAKLALLIGLALGYPLGFFVIILSIWVAALWGIALMLVKKAGPKTALPFGSFIASVAILTIIFQNEIKKIIPNIL